MVLRFCKHHSKKKMEKEERKGKKGKKKKKNEKIERKGEAKEDEGSK